MTRNGAPGVLARLRDGDRMWVGASGFGDITVPTAVLSANGITGPGKSVRKF
ncbi:hypothetical protein [Allokutzneria oryzae]|uniref:Uncharacterized protein n=1 Tax=Allokutzneria oryzae TaxID=1378989 RepID=A0ABV6A0R0_9PSEU